MNTFRAQIGIQEQLRLVQIEVVGNCDHTRAAERLSILDRILKVGCLEGHAIELHVGRCRELALKGIDDAIKREAVLRVFNGRLERLGHEAVLALRVNVLRHELGVSSVRELSRQISGNIEFARFCGLLDGLSIRGSSKSRLDRLTRLFSEEDLRHLHATLTSEAGSADHCNDIGLSQPLDMKTSLVDGTCIESNIHHPTDWTLLADVGRTLLLGVERIRERGLLQRMPQEPKSFRSDFNKLCIQMTHTRRRKDSKSARKGVLRQMKRLLQCIGQHAKRHLQLLKQSWQSHGFSKGQMVQLRDRIEGMLDLLPKVIHQAHERIIGERKVANADKILSVYEPDVHVLVRGKSGQEIEYGNHCFMAENENGYIVDWHLYRDIAPGEPEQLRDSVRRHWKLGVDDKLKAVVSDRGLNSKRNSRFLKRNGIFDATCPRDAQVLGKRMREESFKQLQKRRASTEARIAILKNSRLGGRIRAKGFANRSTTLAWAVLTHNLWLLSNCITAEVNARKKAA